MNESKATDSISELLERLEDEFKTTIKIALFGQPGSGKSSLINAMVGKNHTKVSTETDTTQEAEEVVWGENDSLLLTDLPGFGTTKFPSGTYWDKNELDKYDLFMCVFAGKFHDSDDKLFHKVISKGKQCFFVCNKSDSLFDSNGEKTQDELKADIEKSTKLRYGENVTVVFTSCRTREGFGQLVDEVYFRLEDSQKEKWERNAKAYSTEFLKRKKESCEKIVIWQTAKAALNGANPIPGLNFTVDMQILLSLFKQIRRNFDLTDERVNNVIKLNIYPQLITVANNVLKSVTFDGLIQLLKNQLGKQVARQGSRYLPLIGQLFSAATGGTITYLAGKKYLDDCYELATAILEEELKYKSRIG